MTALPGTHAHPHARTVLLPALPPAGSPSHAYLFHGPPGTGKRTVAREFAAALLSDGAPGAGGDAIRERVTRGAHPDLTWVEPTGANEMLVEDIDQAVIAAVARTPFEAPRRVFVIEGAQTMSDQVANRLLKTIEEPPPWAHLILLANRLQDVLPTIASRCQPVRFDPLPSALIAERLGSPPATDPLPAQACARLSLGDAPLAARLFSPEGQALRATAQAIVRAAIDGQTAARPWLGALAQAKAAGESAGAALQARLDAEAELLPSKDRRRQQREGAEAQRRLERRQRTATVDLILHLAQLWLRDALCLAQGAPQAIHAVDRLAQLQADASRHHPQRLLEGVELVAQTRLRLPLNVSEELAFEALAYRLEELLGDHPAVDPEQPPDPESSGRTRRETASRKTTTAAR